MKKILFLAILLASPFYSCTTSKTMAKNERQEGHYKLYSFPEKREKDDLDTDRFQRIVLISSNDFNAAITPQTYVVKNKFNESRVMKVGGLSAMRSYSDIFRKEFNDAVVHVDAGSFLKTDKNHLYTIFLYNYLNVDVATLGINEFNLKSNYKEASDYISLMGKKSKFKIVASNLFDLKQARSIRWSGIRSHYIKKIKGVKIGFIGITPRDLAKKVSPQNMNGIHIQNEAKNIILKSNELRRKGAKIIVLLSPSPIDCTSKMAHETGIDHDKVNFNPLDATYCDLYNHKLIDSLSLISKESIDIVVTSGNKSKVANFISGYPVLQNSGNGEYLSWVELFYDKKNFTVAREKTIIHQPVRLCHSFFKSTQDCFTKENFNDQELEAARFLGHKVKISPIPIY